MRDIQTFIRCTVQNPLKYLHKGTVWARFNDNEETTYTLQGKKKIVNKKRQPIPKGMGTKDQKFETMIKRNIHGSWK